MKNITFIFLGGIFDGLFGFIFAVASDPRLFGFIWAVASDTRLFGFIWAYWRGLFKGLLGKIFILVLYKLPLLTFTN